MLHLHKLLFTIGEMQISVEYSSIETIKLSHRLFPNFFFQLTNTRNSHILGSEFDRVLWKFFASWKWMALRKVLRHRHRSYTNVMPAYNVSMKIIINGENFSTEDYWFQFIIFVIFVLKSTNNRCRTSGVFISVCIEFTIICTQKFHHFEFNNVINVNNSWHWRFAQVNPTRCFQSCSGSKLSDLIKSFSRYTPIWTNSNGWLADTFFRFRGYVSPRIIVCVINFFSVEVLLRLGSPSEMASPIWTFDSESNDEISPDEFVLLIIKKARPKKSPSLARRLPVAVFVIKKCVKRCTKCRHFIRIG